MNGLNVRRRSAFLSLPEPPPLEPKNSSSASSLTSLMSEIRGPPKRPRLLGRPTKGAWRSAGVDVHSFITQSAG